MGIPTSDEWFWYSAIPRFKNSVVKVKGQVKVKVHEWHIMLTYPFHTLSKFLLEEQSCDNIWVMDYELKYHYANE